MYNQPASPSQLPCPICDGARVATDLQTIGIDPYGGGCYPVVCLTCGYITLHASAEKIEEVKRKVAKAQEKLARQQEKKRGKF